MRISGPKAPAIASSLLDTSSALVPRHATVSRFHGMSAAGAITDEVIATFFPAPRSYTTQDVVEISAHGSPVVLRAIIEAALAAGARLARPGEFTLRAYLGGRMDLTQAEAVADLIGSVTPAQARSASEQLDGHLARAIHALHAPLFDLIARLEASLDFPEEGYHFVARDEAASQLAALRSGVRALIDDGRRGRLIREGVTVAIVGRPNTGKSSLFNRLVGSERAIVSPSPGTTRDVLTEVVDLGGLRATLVDTAGMRQTADAIEAEGVRRANSAAAAATAAVVVLDLSAPVAPEDREALAGTAGARVVVANKCDLPARWAPESEGATVSVSALTGEGLPDLIAAIHRALGATAASEEVPMVTNLRHLQQLDLAAAALTRAAAATSSEPPMPEEFVLADLHEARHALEAIVGVRTSEDVLAHIFERFCIGK